MIPVSSKRSLALAVYDTGSLALDERVDKSSLALISISPNLISIAHKKALNKIFIVNRHRTAIGMDLMMRELLTKVS